MSDFESKKLNYDLRLSVLSKVDSIFEEIYKVMGQPKENETVVEQLMVEEFLLCLMNKIEKNGYQYVKYSCEHCTDE